MHIWRGVLDTTQREGFDRPVGAGQHAVDHHGLVEALRPEIVHQVVGVKWGLVAARAPAFAEKNRYNLAMPTPSSARSNSRLILRSEHVIAGLRPEIFY